MDFLKSFQRIVIISFLKHAVGFLEQIFIPLTLIQMLHLDHIEINRRLLVIIGVEEIQSISEIHLRNIWRMGAGSHKIFHSCRISRHLHNDILQNGQCKRVCFSCFACQFLKDCRRTSTHSFFLQSDSIPELVRTGIVRRIFLSHRHRRRCHKGSSQSRQYIFLIINHII